VFTDNSWTDEALVGAVDTSLVAAAAVEEGSIRVVAAAVTAVAAAACILVAVEVVAGACTEEAEEAKTETAFSWAAPAAPISSIAAPAISTWSHGFERQCAVANKMPNADRNTHEPETQGPKHRP
jgi:hypothetical protein